MRFHNLSSLSEIGSEPMCPLFLKNVVKQDDDNHASHFSFTKRIKPYLIGL